MITCRERDHSTVRAGTILVVEDEEVLRHAVVKTLVKRGFSVLEAKDGSVALKLIRAHKNDIDAVLLDFTLPGIPSREVFQETLRKRPNVGVIVTSAYSVETVAGSFTGLQADQFIRKPFKLGDVVRMLESALSGKANAAARPPNFS